MSRSRHDAALRARHRARATLLGIVSLAMVAAGCTSSDPAAADPCAGPAGTICTWAGDGEPGFDGDGNLLLESSFYWPTDMTFHADGRAWVVDWNNHRVRELKNGRLQTVIGTDFIGDGPDDKSDLTAPGAQGTTIHLNHPTQLVANADGSMTLVSWHNHKLRRFDPNTGLVRVTCGRGAGYSGDGGMAEKALLNQPQAVVWAPDGSMFLADQRNQVIRRIAPGGTITTVAGTPNSPGFGGDGGDPQKAQFNLPTGSNPPPGGWIAVDKDGVLYVADTLNHRIRRIDLAKNVIDTVVGTGQAGFSGDGGKATDAQINNPREVDIGPDGRLYFADEYNNRVRAVDLTTGLIETIAGNGQGTYAGDGGPARDASLYRPAGLAFDTHGELFIIDTYNHRIRRVVGSFRSKQ